MKRDCDLIWIVKCFFLFEGIAVGAFLVLFFAGVLLAVVCGVPYTISLFTADIINLSKGWCLFILIGVLLTLNVYHRAVTYNKK